MILNLEIKNFAIIEDVSVDFESGFNVITGETGTGKSIIVESILFLFGSRMTFKNLKKNVHVKAVFIKENEKLKLERVYDISSKSRYYINGVQVSFSEIEKLKGALIDFHSQMDNMLLVNSDTQFSLLDMYAGNRDILEKYQKLFSKREEILRKLSAMNMNQLERERLIDIKKFQINEIESANLKEGEDIVVEEMISNYKNISKILNNLSEIDELINSDSGLKDIISRIIRKSDDVAKIIPEFSSQLESISRISEEIDSFNDVVSNMISKYSVCDNIDDLIARDELIKKLKRKYSVSCVKELIEKTAVLKKELDELLCFNENMEELECELKEVEKTMEKIAFELSRKRKESARNLSKKIVSILKDLELKNSKFDISIEETQEFKSSGKNTVEFLFSSSPDYPMKPLRYVASGGEISRIMIAIRSIFSKEHNPAVMILDEIDTGVGGNTAFKIGKILRDISKNSQILCITHLPQIAVYADSHIKVEKTTTRTQTYVKAFKLKNKDERIEEIARMLGSEYSSETAKAHAVELLEKTGVF